MLIAAINFPMLSEVHFSKNVEALFLFDRGVTDTRVGALFESSPPLRKSWICFYRTELGIKIPLCWQCESEIFCGFNTKI